MGDARYVLVLSNTTHLAGVRWVDDAPGRRSSGICSVETPAETRSGWHETPHGEIAEAGAGCVRGRTWAGERARRSVRS